VHFEQFFTCYQTGKHFAARLTLFTQRPGAGRDLRPKMENSFIKNYSVPIDIARPYFNELMANPDKGSLFQIFAT